MFSPIVPYATNWEVAKAAAATAYSALTTFPTHTHGDSKATDTATSKKSSMGMGKKLAIGAAITAAAGYTAYSLGLGTTHFPLPSAITDTVSAAATTAGGYMSSTAATVGAYIPSCISNTVSVARSHLPSVSQSAVLLGVAGLGLGRVVGRGEGFLTGAAFAGQNEDDVLEEFCGRIEKQVAASQAEKASA